MSSAEIVLLCCYVGFLAFLAGMLYGFWVDDRRAAGEGDT